MMASSGTRRQIQQTLVPVLTVTFRNIPVASLGRAQPSSTMNLSQRARCLTQGCLLLKQVSVCRLQSMQPVKQRPLLLLEYLKAIQGELVRETNLMASQDLTE